ncbi:MULTISPECIES: HK97 family phage prohead protease [unclassified Streptomyces]|uniref:HK97 family phage prohead protease n=1 Tax=unclassified Streptomyces TaxID=2593676 RepID=UPI00331DEE45
MPSPLSPSVVQRRARGGKGIVRAIYAVTGVVDEVNDLILPGTFARTLKARRVKAVWHHEWKDPVGTVLSIEEWLPGDPRFKTIPGGVVWPEGAGALVATVQYNLRTTLGRDAYEQVKQWHENGEAQFSIGYKVTKAGASKRHDGVRIIHDLDLYEISPVLHGAHPMTRSIEVKAATRPGALELERKATWSSVELERKTSPEQQIGNGVMVALKIPPDVAGKIEQDGGTPAEHLHITLAYLGDVGELGGHPDDLRDIVARAVNDNGPLTGSIGGIGRFPDTGEGVPTWAPTDVPGLAELRQNIVLALANSVYSDAVRHDHGFTPHVTLGYDMPDVGPIPATPVTFTTLHVVRGGDEFEIPLGAEDDEEPASVPDDQTPPTSPPSPAAQGFANRVMAHYDQLHTEGKAAALAVLEAKVPGGRHRGDAPRVPAVETKSAAQIVLEAKSARYIQLPERPMSTPMPFSFEQIRDQVAAAARSLFAPPRDDDEPAAGPAPDNCWVAVEATYPDHVLVTRHGGGDYETYSIPYTVTGRDVSLGVPQRVQLTTIATPVDGEEREAEGDEAVQARVIDPTGRALTDATARIQVADASPQHLEQLKPTISKLLAAMSAKGVPIHDSPDDDQYDGWDVSEGWDDDPDDRGTGDDSIPYDDPEDDTDVTGGADDDPPAVPPGNTPADNGDSDTGDDPDDEDQHHLDASEVKAALAALAL